MLALRAFLGVLGALAAVLPAAAAETYAYAIEHSRYGTIGSYVDTVARGPDGLVRIDTRMRIAVRVLGVVAHRETADRTEVWRDGRLVAFSGVTVINGERLDVRGEAGPDGFVVTGPQGRETAPADVRPSSPWSVQPGRGVMMSTKTGRLEPVSVSGGAPCVVTVNGTGLPGRTFEVVSDKHQAVVVDAHGVPLRFRSEEEGGTVDFVLTGVSGTQIAVK